MFLSRLFRVRGHTSIRYPRRLQYCGAALCRSKAVRERGGGSTLSCDPRLSLGVAEMQADRPEKHRNSPREPESADLEVNIRGLRSSLPPCVADAVEEGFHCGRRLAIGEFARNTGRK